MISKFTEKPIELSVILPTLNEEQTIETCIRKIQNVFENQGIFGEIIVSDSSTDKTPEIARALGARVIHPISRGYGCAYTEAFAHTRGRYIIIGDADNTYDFNEIPLLIDEMEKGFDLVVGSRFRGTIKDGAMTPLHRYIGNPILTFVLNRVFHTNFTDTHSGFRAIRSDALKRLHLQSYGMEFASEMLINASREGLKISEVPITYYPRITPSKLASFSDGWRHLRFFLLVKPIPFLAVPGMLSVIFGLILMGAFHDPSGDPSARTHSFILGTMLMMGGIQMLFFGIVIKIYSSLHGFEKEGLTEKILLNYKNLEKFLSLGSVFILAGVCLGGYILYEWIRSGFGALHEISNATLSLALVTIGVEIVFIAVFISMMCLNREPFSN